MARSTLIATVLSVTWLVAVARGQDAPDAPATDVNQPRYSTDVRWVGPALIGVGTLFAAALGIGGTVWMKMRDVVPTAASHEEDPSADRH